MASPPPDKEDSMEKWRDEHLRNIRNSILDRYMHESFECNLCGNHSHAQGFFSCTEDGTYSGDGEFWRCDNCGQRYNNLESKHDK